MIESDFRWWQLAPMAEIDWRSNRGQLMNLSCWILEHFDVILDTAALVIWPEVMVSETKSTGSAGCTWLPNVSSSAVAMQSISSNRIVDDVVTSCSWFCWHNINYSTRGGRVKQPLTRWLACLLCHVWFTKVSHVLTLFYSQSSAKQQCAHNIIRFNYYWN